MLKRIRMFFVMLAALMLIAAPAMATDVNNFNELKAAIAEGGSIKLLKDITGIEESLILNQKDVVLDLNGKELSTSSGDFYGSFINVNGGSLRIDNGGTITSNKTFYIKGGGSLEIAGPCTLKTLNSYMIGLDCSSSDGENTLSISGNAKLHGTSNISMITLNTSKSYANNILISNGEFHGVIEIKDYDKTPEKFQITGGAFSADPSNYLKKDDYKAVYSETDSLYHVQRKPAIKFEKKELTLSEGERRDITAMIFGVTEGKYDVTADSSSTSVKVENVSYNGDSATITVSGQHVGESVLTATLTYGEETKSADCTITVSGATPTPGPIDPAPKPVKPAIGNVPDDVKAEIKPELAVTEGDPAAAAKKIGGALAAEQLTRNKDGNTIVKPEVAVKAANKLGTLSSVTSKDVVALPVFTTPAIDADKDKTIMISYEVLGSDLKAKKPADVKVMKILGAENGELFTYASAITKDMDKKFTVMKDDDSGTIFTGDIDGYTMYRLALFIKDGGKFDLDGKKDGAVADPTVILGAEKRAPSGGSGGCNAGLGVLALLLSLAALPLVYKRKK